MVYVQIASDGHDVNRTYPAFFCCYCTVSRRNAVDMHELFCLPMLLCAGVFYTGTCTDAIDAASQCLSAGVDQDLGGMSFGPRCDVRNTTIYGCGSAVTEGGTCPHCPIDPYGAANANSSILLTGISQDRVQMPDVDRATANVLRAKFAARLFDEAKYRDPNESVKKIVRNRAHRTLARQAAQEGAILLLNHAAPPRKPINNCSNGHFLRGMDWGGDNNQSFVKVSSIRQCCQACAGLSWCNHFSLTASSMDCFMKGGPRSLVSNPGSTAGYCSKGAPLPPGPPPTPILPLDKAEVKRLAVVGPNADSAGNQLGQYECTQNQEEVVTVLQGLRAAVGAEAVDYAIGADWHSATDPALINAAVAAVQNASVGVLVLGDDTSTCGESRDRDDLDLPGSQLDLLEAVTSRTETPIVVVLINCRPATFGSGGNSKFGSAPNTLLSGVQALLVAWNNGAEGGHAVADLLFGVVSPSGRLAANWLNSVGDAAATSSTWGLARQQSDYDRTLENGDPVAFVFGFGLDYLDVTRSTPTLRPTNISANGSATLSVDIRNSASARGGGYAVQVYFRQRVGRIARPNLLLANFTKVWLPASGSVRTTKCSLHVLFVLSLDRVQSETALMTDHAGNGEGDDQSRRAGLLRRLGSGAAGRHGRCAWSLRLVCVRRFGVWLWRQLQKQCTGLLGEKAARDPPHPRCE